MDDLQRRFRRLDRVTAPSLWNEAVARSVAVQAVPRRAFVPAYGLIAVALLLAALAGTIAVGALLNRNQPDVLVEYDNGMVTLSDGCGTVVGIDPTTFQPRDLVSGTAECRFGWGSAEWSSDGRWMAYLAGGEGGDGVWLYDAEADEARLLPGCASTQCVEVDISPDGSLATFLTVRVEESDDANRVVQFFGLGLVETDSGVVHAIDLPGLAGRPSFSPDGDQIAITLQGGQSGVHVLDVADVMEGTFPQDSLVFGIVEAAKATWSPNGAWIAAEVTSYRQASCCTPSLWVVRPDGTEARPLTSPLSGLGDRSPSWSPDSTTIAYLAATEEGVELRTVAIDGGPVTRLRGRECCGWIGQPAWSPDGEWIAFAQGGDDQGPEVSGIVIVRPDGSEPRLVSELTADPAWQPIPRD